MKLIKSTLVGIGQIFLQENGLSGLIIGVAMFFSHWTLGLGCFLGAFIGTSCASLLRFPAERIKQGLYGFNASLAFMCCMFTYGLVDASNPMIWLVAVLASIVATLVMHLFLEWGKVAFTFPFVLSCWLFCWAFAKYGWFDLQQSTPPLLDYASSARTLFSEPFYAWAEINFGSSLITGVLLFVAIAISSPIAAMWGMAVAPISAIFAHELFEVETNTIANGIYSFSAILVACAFAGKRFMDFVYVIIGVLLAVIVQHSVVRLGVATYTIGFIVASWFLLWLKNGINQAQLVSPSQSKKIGKWFNP